MEGFPSWKREKCHKNIHNEPAQAQKEREPVSRFPLKKCLFIRFGLTEVTLQQALESLAVAGLVAGHLMDGVVDGVQVQLLGLLGQLKLAHGGAVLSVHTHLQVAKRLRRSAPDSVQRQKLSSLRCFGSFPLLPQLDIFHL